MIICFNSILIRFKYIYFPTVTVRCGGYNNIKGYYPLVKTDAVAVRNINKGKKSRKMLNDSVHSVLYIELLYVFTLGSRFIEYVQL